MKLTKGRLSKIKKMKRQTRYNRKKPRKIGSRKSFRKRRPKHFLYSSLKKRRRVQKGGQDWLSGLGMALGSMQRQEVALGLTLGELLGPLPAPLRIKRRGSGSSSSGSSSSSSISSGSSSSHVPLMRSKNQKQAVGPGKEYPKTIGKTWTGN